METENFWKLMGQVACHTTQENKEAISKKEEGEDPHPKLPPIATCVFALRSPQILNALTISHRSSHMVLQIDPSSCFCSESEPDDQDPATQCRHIS